MVLKNFAIAEVDVMSPMRISDVKVFDRLVNQGDATTAAVLDNTKHGSNITSPMIALTDVAGCTACGKLDVERLEGLCPSRRILCDLHGAQEGTWNEPGNPMPSRAQNGECSKLVAAGYNG